MIYLGNLSHIGHSVV